MDINSATPWKMNQSNPPSTEFLLHNRPVYVGSATYSEIRNILPYSVLAFYPAEIQDAKADATFCVDLEWLAGEFMGAISRTGDIDQFNAMAKELYGPAAELNHTDSERWNIAKYKTLGEIRSNADELLRRLQLTAGINIALEKRVPPARLKAMIGETNNYLRTFDQDEIPTVGVELLGNDEGAIKNKVEFDSSLLEIIDDAPKEQLDAVECVEVTPSVQYVGEQLKLFYSLLGLDEGSPDLGTFRHDSFVLEEIIEGMAGATIRMQDQQSILKELQKVLESMPLVKTHMRKQMLMGLAMESDIGTQRRVIEAIGNDYELMQMYASYLKKSRAASTQDAQNNLMSLKAVRQDLSSPSANNLYTIVQAEHEMPIILINIGLLNKMSYSQVKTFSEQIGILKDYAFRKIRTFYKDLMENKENKEYYMFLENVGAELGAFLDMPELYHIRVGENAASEPTHEPVSEVSVLLDYLIDPDKLPIVIELPEIRELIENLGKNQEFKDAWKLVTDGREMMVAAEQEDPQVTKSLSLEESPMTKRYTRGENMVLEGKAGLKELFTDEILGGILQNAPPELSMLLGNGHEKEEVSEMEALKIYILQGENEKTRSEGKTPLDMVYRDAISQLPNVGAKARFKRWMVAYKKLKCLLYPDMGARHNSTMPDNTFDRLEKKVLANYGVHPDSIMFDEERGFFERKYTVDAAIYDANKPKMDEEFAQSVITLMTQVYNALKTELAEKTDPDDEKPGNYLSAMDIADRVDEERNIMNYVRKTIADYVRKDLQLSSRFKRKVRDYDPDNPGNGHKGKERIEEVFDNFKYLLDISECAMTALAIKMTDMRTNFYKKGEENGGNTLSNISQMQEDLTLRGQELNYLNRLYGAIKYDITANTIKQPEKPAEGKK